MPTRTIPVLVRAGAFAAAVVILAACTPGGQFDPTVLLENDMFTNKKELQGQRQPVFPNGVPGTTTGIPPDLMKGYQPPPDQTASPDAGAPNAAAAGQPQPTAEAEPKPKAKPKPKPKVARAAPPRPRISVSPPGQTTPAETSQTAWPSPQQNTQVWPASPPAGQPQQSAQQPSQSIWPSPPPTGSSTQ